MDSLGQVMEIEYYKNWKIGYVCGTILMLKFLYVSFFTMKRKKQIQHTGGAENLRPLLAHPEDVALVVPEDVDPKVIEGFLQEAPGQAVHLIRLIRSIVAGSGDFI